MILDNNHPDVNRYGGEEKSRLNQGLCGKCGHDSFSVYKLKSTISGKQVYLCKKCEEPYSTHVFRPRNVV